MIFSAGAAAAAAAAAQLKRDEEVMMTPYQPDDLANHWEFKILRSATGAFKDPAVLKTVLEEEGRAGWMLVEKFDNGRIRLKRPPGAQTDDATLGFDAYRTVYGVTDAKLVILILVGVFAGLVAAGLVVALFAR